MSRPEFLREGFGTVARLGWEEIRVPEAVAYQPRTVGWSVLAVAVAAVLTWVARRRIRKYRADAYRRRALAALAELRGRIAANLSCATELPVLLKRAALDGFPRRDVASLTGSAWTGFLDATSNNGFDAESGDLLVRLSYRGADGVAPADVERLLDDAADWIRRHRAAV